MIKSTLQIGIQTWPIDRLQAITLKARLLTNESRTCYLRAEWLLHRSQCTFRFGQSTDSSCTHVPRKNDAAVDRMCSSIREFGFKVPVLARSDGEVVDGHLRLKAARKLGSWPGGDTSTIPVLLCEEWTPAQVKAFRLMVNRSATWADFDEELLALELQELKESDFDLSLTGFDPKELDDLLLAPDNDELANAVPPVPENPVSRAADLWLCGKHRVLCSDATSPEAVAKLLGDRKPHLMVTDPPYGIELDSEWRDRAGLNGCGPAEASYMKNRTEGHTETTISGDTRADADSGP